jgi:NAD(P)-dependent dehydrogenase (short-subunit alcohol dehydrogenase family)
MTKLKPLSQQVIVVTGASSGIGRATALMAASRGARVVVAARGGGALGDVVREIEAAGGVASACVTDVAKAAEVDRLAEHAIAVFGRIDTWVNNAGVAIAGRLDAMPEEDARRLFDVNFWGTVHGTRAALPHLKRDGGALINVGSFTSDVAAPFMGMYSASKQAIKGYTDGLRIELKMDGAPVSVTLIKPGPIATPILEHQRNRMDHQATMPPPFYLPEDVAKTILYAAEHAVRDLFVGGAARFGSVLAQALPGLTDAATAMMAPRLFKTGAPPARRPDNLYEPSRNTRVDGDSHGHSPRPSMYTALRTNPLFSTAMVIGGGALALLATRRQR